METDATTKVMANQDGNKISKLKTTTKRLRQEQLPKNEKKLYQFVLFKAGKANQQISRYQNVKDKILYIMSRHNTSGEKTLQPH